MTDEKEAETAEGEGQTVEKESLDKTDERGRKSDKYKKLRRTETINGGRLV